MPPNCFSFGQLAKHICQPCSPPTSSQSRGRGLAEVAVQQAVSWQCSNCWEPNSDIAHCFQCGASRYQAGPVVHSNGPRFRLILTVLALIAALGLALWSDRCRLLPLTAVVFLVAIAFLLLRYIPQSRWAAAAPEEYNVLAADVALSTLEDRQPVEDCLERLWVRIRSTTPPSALEELLADGWRDCSNPKAKIYLAFRAPDEQEPDRRVICSQQINTEDQIIPFNPFITEGEGGDTRLLGGAFPVFCSLREWPSWFPFCHTAIQLKSFGPARAIWLLQFKIAFLKIDIVKLFSLEDNLDTTGTIDMVMQTPPVGSEGQEWLGITVPPLTGQLRATTNAARLSYIPLGSDRGKLNIHCEAIDVTGIQWITVLFWSKVSTLVVPKLMEMHYKYCGEGSTSTLAQRIREDKDLSSHFLGMHARIESFVEDGLRRRTVEEKQSAEPRCNREGGVQQLQQEQQQQQQPASCSSSRSSFNTVYRKLPVESMKASFSFKDVQKALLTVMIATMAFHIGCPGAHYAVI